MQEPLSLSVVSLISSFQCSSAGDFLATHALAAHDRRSTIDGRSRSFLVCAISTLANSENSWKWIQLQQEHTNSRSWWQRPSMLAAKCPACCAVAKPSAEACDFLATLTRSPSTIDGELQAFSLLPLFQTTTDINKQVQYEHANTNLRAKATYVRSKPWCCVAANPFAGKVPSSLQIRDLERTRRTQNAVRWFLFGSYVPTASTLEEKLLTQNPSTR